MANTANECNHLELENKVYTEIDNLFQTQKDLQENTYGYRYSEMNLNELVKFLLMNKHALEDEMGETMDAIGGIHDGIGPAAWKPWKKDNIHAHKLKVTDLTERDRKELLFEMADQLHFFINQVVACGFSGSDLANAYYSKNRENINRQKNGY